MKKIFGLFILLIALGCQKQPSSREEVEKSLKTAMQKYLYEQIHNDSTHVKYHVKDVIFFEDKTFYDCEFKVELSDNRVNFDTTGTMSARISKDFSRVTRRI